MNVAPSPAPPVTKPDAAQPAKNNRLKTKTPVRAWMKCLGAGMAWLGNLMVMAALPASGAASATLSWDPSTSPNITGYYFYSGGASGTYTNKIYVGNVTSLTLTNLVAGRICYFAVTSYNSTGIESMFSSQVTYLVPAVVLPPILGSPTYLARRFSFVVPGVAGSRYVVEASVNLVTWTRVVTNTAPFTFVETNSSQVGKKFFRTVSVP